MRTRPSSSPSLPSPPLSKDEDQKKGGSNNGDGELTVLQGRCKLLEERCSKLSDSEQQATDELERRLQKMQEEEKRLNYLGSQVKTLQAEVDVAADRAQEAENLVSELKGSLELERQESERLSRGLEASEAKLASALLDAVSAEAPTPSDG